MPHAFDSTDDIATANARAGFHFFEADTLRFFKSRIGSNVIDGWLFTTSEKGPSNRREYSVRFALSDGKVDTLGNFQGFSTARQAERYAERANVAYRVALAADALPDSDNARQAFAYGIADGLREDTPADRWRWKYVKDATLTPLYAAGIAFC